MATIKGGKVKSIRKLKTSLKRRGGQYLTRIPNEGIVVRFAEEPTEWVEYTEHYDEHRDPRYFPCVEEDCEGDHSGKDGTRPSKRYLTNAIDVEENKAIPLVLPVTAASSLLKKYDRYNTLLDRDYALMKEGTGRDTEYDVTPEAPSRLNLAKFETFDLLALLQAQLAGSEDDDEDDDDDLSADDEEARPNPRRKSASKKSAPVTKKRPMKKTSTSGKTVAKRPTKKRKPPY